MLPFVTVRDHTFFTEGLGPQSVIVDAGANLGDFSRGCAELFGCSPYALEPNPASAAHITDAAVFALALSNGESTSELFLADNSEACSLLHSADHTGSITVRTTTLDSFRAEQRLPRIDLLKLDIEGAELDVLQGLGSSCNIAQITVEFHDFIFPEHRPRVRAVIRHLTSLGFTCYNFSAPRHLDVLFVDRRLIPLGLYARFRARARVIARWLRRRIQQHPMN